MKISKIVITLVIGIITALPANGQKKIGVFVHGFNGSSEKWLQESGVPQAWKSSGVITDYVVLNYKTEELATTQTQAQLLAKFDQAMRSKGSKSVDKWILVGHSLGGIVSRVLYPKFKQLDYNIVGVVSIGGPGQGAEATNVSTTLINSTVTRMKNKINAAQEHVAPTVSFLLSMESIFAAFSLNTSLKSQIAAIPDYLEDAREIALGYAGDLDDVEAASLIGRNGSITQLINSFSATNYNYHPKNYLSVIGAEKSKIPFRMIGHVTGNDEYKNEYKVVNQINDLRNGYFSRNEGYYRQLADRYHWCRFLKSCRDSRDYAHYRENLWKQAKLEIDNIDITWGQLINSYKFTTAQVRKYIPECEYDGGPGGTPMFAIGITPDGGQCSTIPGGEYIYISQIVRSADKNDGVVNINSALWHSNDSFDDANNLFMSDVPTDGGYNHFELRNHKRDYTLPGVFQKEEKNPSMSNVEIWLNAHI